MDVAQKSGRPRGTAGSRRGECIRLFSPGRHTAPAVRPAGGPLAFPSADFGLLALTWMPAGPGSLAVGHVRLHTFWSATRPAELSFDRPVGAGDAGDLARGPEVGSEGNARLMAMVPMVGHKGRPSQRRSARFTFIYTKPSTTGCRSRIGPPASPSLGLGDLRAPDSANGGIHRPHRPDRSIRKLWAGNGAPRRTILRRGSSRTSTSADPRKPASSERGHDPDDLDGRSGLLPGQPPVLTMPIDVTHRRDAPEVVPG